jgi:hypothetical protein
MHGHRRPPVSPLPSPSFSLPDELNYLLSLLTPDDCSFPTARYHLYHGVMFRCPLYPLSPIVWRSQEHVACLSQVPTIITFLSRLEEVQFVFAVRQESEKRRVNDYINFLLHVLIFLALTLWMKSTFQFRPWFMGVGSTRRPSDWAGMYPLVSGIQRSWPYPLSSVFLPTQPRRKLCHFLALTCSGHTLVSPVNLLCPMSPRQEQCHSISRFCSLPTFLRSALVLVSFVFFALIMFVSWVV